MPVFERDDVRERELIMEWAGCKDTKVDIGRWWEIKKTSIRQDGCKFDKLPHYKEHLP